MNSTLLVSIVLILISAGIGVNIAIIKYFLKDKLKDLKTVLSTVSKIQVDMGKVMTRLDITEEKNHYQDELIVEYSKGYTQENKDMLERILQNLHNIEISMRTKLERDFVTKEICQLKHNPGGSINA